MASVALVALQVHESRPWSYPFGIAPPAGGGAADAAPAIPARARPVYLHSVVPGGVYSPQEVRDAIAADPMVAAHYSGLRPEAIRAVHVDAPRRVYVSYRLGDEIYWTKNAVALHLGEQILTDGVREIRSRCGNGISDRPMEPVSDREPEAFEFDLVLPRVAPGLAPLAVRPQGSGLSPQGWATPGASATESGGVPNAPTPWSSAADPGRAFIGPVPLPDSGKASSGAPPSRAVGGGGTRAVPEPGLLWTMGIGLAMYTFRRLRRTAAAGPSLHATSGTHVC
jgi:hypothetical protein